MPLIGLKGGINCNPTLFCRQLGYFIKVPPREKYVEESLFYYVPDSTGWMVRAANAWRKIHLEENTYFGKR